VEFLPGKVAVVLIFGGVFGREEKRRLIGVPS